MSDLSKIPGLAITSTATKPESEMPVRKATRKYTVKRGTTSKGKPPKGWTDPAPPDNQFAGMTNTKCAAACTADHCVISTVGVCKHPMTTSASGCGPITLANRAAALKYLKHQAVEKG